MRLRNYPIISLSAAVVLLTACSAAQSQGTLPADITSKVAATQSVNGPLASLPRLRLLYVGAVLGKFSGVSVYRRRGNDEHRVRQIRNKHGGATGLAVDSSDNLYVGQLGGSTVTVYPRGSKTPSETLTDAGVPYGVAVSNDGTVYVANKGTTKYPPSILVYAKGHTKPSQTIPISDGAPFELAVDSSGNLFATVDQKDAPYKGAVYEFAPGSSQGKKLSLRGLAGGELTGISFDKNNDLLVLDRSNHSTDDVFVFPPGKMRPSQKIGINSTYVAIGIAINRENTEIWVTVAGTVQGLSYPGGTLLDVIHETGLTTGVAVSPASNE